MLQFRTRIPALAVLFLSLFASGAFCAGKLSEGGVAPASATANSIFTYTVTWTADDDRKMPIWPSGQLVVTKGTPILNGDGTKIVGVTVQRPDPEQLPPQLPIFFDMLHGRCLIVRVFQGRDDCVYRDEDDLFDKENGTWAYETDPEELATIDLGKEVDVPVDAEGNPLPPEQINLCVHYRLPGYVAVERITTEDGYRFYLSHTPVEWVAGIFPAKDSLNADNYLTDSDPITNPYSSEYGLVRVPFSLGLEPGAVAWAVYLTGPIVLEIDKATSFYRQAAEGDTDPSDTWGAETESVEGSGTLPFPMGFWKGNALTGAIVRVRLSAGLNLANDPTAVPGVNYARGHVGGGEDWHQVMKRRFTTYVADGPRHAKEDPESDGDWTESPSVYNSRAYEYMPLNGGILEKVTPTSTTSVTVSRTPVWTVRAVYRDDPLETPDGLVRERDERYEGPAGVNYFDLESGGEFNALTGELFLSTELPDTDRDVWVLYTPDPYFYHQSDPSNNLRYGGSGSGCDLVAMHYTGDPLVPEFNPPIDLTKNPNGYLTPYDDDYPDDGTGNTAFWFRIAYQNCAGLMPRAWLPSYASPSANASSGVVLYLDVRGTGDYVPYFMQKADPLQTKPDT